ncbi:hypothetical protein ORJ66_04640 [Pseudoalteromonas tunicata]|uniref:hypothetical protein n=1 Tax=Pseudoalteromonas tunicata TaxID=314281 RepID=UPI00273F08CD|nr:hypothetical protein [Pseudoalteromonas tunicata]MDP5212328.1 hypothetical protein [Pseudoalteromonas tunicata]
MKLTTLTSAKTTLTATLLLSAVITFTPINSAKADESTATTTTQNSYVCDPFPECNERPTADKKNEPQPANFIDVLIQQLIKELKK